MKIACLDAVPLIDENINMNFLKKYDCEAKIYETTKKEDVISRLKGIDIALVNKVVINKEVIDNTNLKCILEMGTGYNNIDVKYANSKGIIVANVKDYSTDSVAEHTLSFILYALHHVSLHNETIEKWVNNSTFSYYLKPVIELKNKTVGIIGYGNIAKKTIKILKAFDANVICYNRTTYDDGTKFVSLDELLETSDIISLHAPLVPLYDGIMNKENLAKLKGNVILVNTARGGFVDEEAILNALDENKLALYLTDVLTVEPPQDNHFIGHSKVIATPHIAWASVEARLRLIEGLENNLKLFLDDKLEGLKQ